MADAENAVSASKKRAAGRQISKENPELDDNTSEPEMGTFQKASEEVLATRRIVKVRRQSASSTSSNPFAGIRLVPPVESTTKEDPHVAVEEANRSNDEQGEESEIKTLFDEANGAGESNEYSENEVTDDRKEVEPDKLNIEESDGQVAEKSKEACEKSVNEVFNDQSKEVEETILKAPADASPFSSFRQLSSSQNAFTSLSGTGFATSSFSFGSMTSNNGTSSSPLFAKSGSIQTSLQVVPVETGEENEKLVFAADATLYEYLDGSWKERGRGEIKVNASLSGEKARLVMRTKGNYRLILNASIYPDMTLTDMEKKGITFSCINSAAEGRSGLTTCALKFRDSSFVEDFRGAVTEYKGKSSVALKTPENSPKGLDK
ncbi:hypothetical protein KSP39_PZI011981 [Platanthera zijinensis]|uniref:RanBD1 domain-containing protein n=1 Tax=Platanthera zijinensis TaxID=2320716 RepID=A0AAP0BFJ6_9ASPA